MELLSIFKDVTNSVSKREEFKEIEDEKLKQKLIKFPIKHFNDYEPKIEYYRILKTSKI